MRVRFTVRRMMLLTAFIAVGLFAVQEFRDGLPPRFVLRGIPARINRLKPGMTHEQTSEILGLNRSWLLGGTSARSEGGSGNGRRMTLTYLIRPRRTVMRMGSEGGGPRKPIAYYESPAAITLWFRWTKPSQKREDMRLTRATFYGSSAVHTEMPGSE